MTEHTHVVTEMDETVEGLMWLRLSRPEARNAYSMEMVHGLVAALTEATLDDAVRAVVITGEGSAFSAGGDLKLMQEHRGMFAGGPAEVRTRYLEGIHQIPRRIARFDKPLIAAVNGPAIGAGLDLACMCDIRIAAASAKFGSTFVRVGLIPGDGGAYFLTRTVGFPRALELVMSGRILNTEEALRIGLVSAVVEDAELQDAARKQAERLLRASPIAVRLAKRLCYRAYESSLEASLELAASYQGMAQTTADHDEAVAAMLEKRRPVYRGK
ncbi:MAG: 2-(1,2-epoxy-1,2-dihydrophenyl)acetyl-CoA isomerase [Myxococcota bacterium]|jgi:2-(1,2-epoxy-1,2-dihydrophenyl)acetyl-CoA isomerase